MPVQVVELTPEEFTAERFQPLFEHVAKEAGRPFDARYFFPQWRLLMDRMLVKTWAVEDSAALGAIFARDLYSGQLRVSVFFWFALPEVRHTLATGRLFEAMEQSARALGAVDIQSAAHQKLHPSRREYGYQKHGFVKSETVYTKTL